MQEQAKQGHTIAAIVEEQRRFFRTGATLPVAGRREYLRRLSEIIRRMEPEIAAALQEDLGKSRAESYMTEIGLSLSELRYFRRNLPGLAARRRKPTPVAHMPARSYELPVPYGVVLIMSPWNYPFLLSIEPLIDALAAGNTAVVKVSADAPAAARVVEKLLSSVFPREYVAVIAGGREENQALLSQKFDYIFFTGGKAAGRFVMEQAAKTLTPVSLELGGKSPCIVDETADLKRAAVRIAFGKFINAGQTCVAPDYVLAQESICEPLIQLLSAAVKSQYGSDPLHNPHYPTIVNERHLYRLQALLDSEKLVFGGRVEGLRMEPALMRGITLSDAAMQEEIFGPVLPVISYRTAEEAEAIIAAHPNPLALYLFSRNGEMKRRFLEKVPFGGGCLNDTLVHLASPHLRFGGIGESGMGSYHGRQGFETFSHIKSIVETPVGIGLPLRYPPYTRRKEQLVRLFLR